MSGSMQACHALCISLLLEQAFGALIPQVVGIWFYEAEEADKVEALLGQVTAAHAAAHAQWQVRHCSTGNTCSTPLCSACVPPCPLVRDACSHCCNHHPARTLGPMLTHHSW